MAVIVLGVILPAPAGAQEAGEQAQDVKVEARRLYEEGKRQYNVGDFDRAIESWKRGYELHPSPDFLFNIGQAYRRKPNAEQALFFFRAYLREKPNASNRPEVEASVAELEAELEQRRQEAEREPSQEPTTRPSTAVASSAEEAPPRGGSMRLAGLISAGVGVALVATGAYFLTSAASTADDLEAAAARHEPWTDALADDERSGERKATLGAVGVGVGAAAIVAGGALYLLGWRQGNVSARAALGPGGASAGLELRF
jgi:tetratricopeptide (TPR) repeat protein